MEKRNLSATSGDGKFITAQEGIREIQENKGD
jgi:hypothetical protein